MSVMILDGGMGQELISRMGRATGLWATQALLEAPHLVREVHDDFFAAGAEVATTNTYAVLPDRFETFGIQDSMARISTLACELAVSARDAHGSGLVLGAVGPMGFSYQPDKAPPKDEAAEGYAQLARLQASLVDAHIAETMASVDQVEGALMGLGVTGKPVWLGITVDDDDGTKLRSGEPLEHVFPLLEKYRPAKVLINCATPEAVGQAIPVLAKQSIPFGAYANGFTGISNNFDHIGATVDVLTARTDLDPEGYTKFAQNWVDDGATLVGGCCEVGPSHIAALAAKFK